MNTSSVLDVRTIPGPLRHPRVFETFDALSPREAFVLVNDHYPKPLLMQFMSNRPGLFEWSILEAGPALFRVRIQKRDEPSARQVGEFLEADHRRLDELAAHAQRALSARDFDAAAAPFAEFACGLERHMQVEELVLFPCFEQATGMVGGPTFVMTREHGLLRELVASASRALSAKGAADAGRALQDLGELLQAHNAKEEGIIYPRTSRALNEQQNDELVRRMQAL